MKIQKGFRYLSLSVLISMMLLGHCSAATPVGTIIDATAQCSYLDEAGNSMPAVVSSAADVTVSQAAALTCTVDPASQAVFPGTSIGYTVTITNQGNAADSYTATISTTTSGWQAGILNTSGSVSMSPAVQTSPVQPSFSASMLVFITPPAQVSAGTVFTATVTVVSAADATVSQSVTLSAVAQAPKTNNIRDWLIMGTFSDGTSNPLVSDYLGGEPYVAPGIGYAGLTWNEFNEQTDPVDLGAIFGDPQNCVAYAGVYINSDVDQSVVLSYTSTGANEVWLNGSAVSVEKTPPSDPTQAQAINVHLFAGSNRLLMKFAASTSPWQFTVQLVDASGNPLGNVETTTQRGNSVAVTFSDVQATSVDSSNETLTWTTNVPTSTALTYSSDFGTNSVQDPALTLQHSVTLTNLQPRTTYTVTPEGVDAYTCSYSGQDSSFTTVPATPIWITGWLLNGLYYDTSLTVDFLGGEASIMPSSGLSTNTRDWKPAVTDSAGVLDFTNYYYGPASYKSCAYAHVYVYSPSTQSATLLTGSNDGIAAFLNGQCVLLKTDPRAFVPDQDSTPVKLVQGWNSLMVKVSQYTGPWLLCARLVGPNGAPLATLTYQIDHP